VLFPKVGVDAAAPDSQKGPQDSEFAPLHPEFGGELHALQPGRTTEEIEEDGLGIVITVVGQEEAVAFAAFGAFREELVPGLSGRGLEGQALFVGKALNVHPTDLEGELVLFGEVTDEGRIVAGEQAPELVVEMAEGDLPTTGREEGVQESYRIPAPGNPEQVRLAKFESWIEREHGAESAARNPVRQ
jgi:hypothetical protein